MNVRNLADRLYVCTYSLSATLLIYTPDLPRTFLNLTQAVIETKIGVFVEHCSWRHVLKQRLSAGGPEARPERGESYGDIIQMLIETSDVPR